MAKSDRHDARDGASRAVHSFAVAYEGWLSQLRRFLSINAHERLALAHLYESGPLTMTELGERIPLSRAAVTALTDRLEKMGYLTRTNDPNDRRRTMISITDKPQLMLADHYGPFNVELAAFVAQIPEEEWASFDRILGGLRTISDRQTMELRKRHRIKVRGDDVTTS